MTEPVQITLQHCRICRKALIQWGTEPSEWSGEKNIRLWLFRCPDHVDERWEYELATGQWTPQHI